MEEAAQVGEVETFIPMMLQKGDDTARLKRVVLIGDHNQLPPVVQNLALQKYSHLDQSLFARLVRLGVPSVQLNCQGRARPTISRLYSWRYKALGDLPSVQGQSGEGSGVIGTSSAPTPALLAATSSPEYTTANGGFAELVQFVDVEDYGGRGESTPLPHFYQNLGEAEFIVATFQYMRLCGYPASRIAILTTYNGQKSLLRDVIKRRCSSQPFFGEPAHVETVDKFQGQQADYVLLSLVRTRAVGHLRDVRRLVVSLSRARLGLYIFGRASLFSSCYEISPALGQLLKKQRMPVLALHEAAASSSSASSSFASSSSSSATKPIPPANSLSLLLGEIYGTTRLASDAADSFAALSGGLLMRAEVTDADQMARIVSQVQSAMSMAATMQSHASSSSSSVGGK
jgi:intron-binding protein aquarius